MSILPNEVLFLIWLELDVEQLEQLDDPILSSNHFWKCKFEKDKLPILSSVSLTTSKEWIQEYRHIKQLVEQADQIVKCCYQQGTITYGGYSYGAKFDIMKKRKQLLTIKEFSQP